MNTKLTNPKDGVGVRKWRQFTCIPMTVMAYVGAALLEGARKYGRHNYRVAGVRSSVYIDAAMGHLIQYQEGEDIDADSGLRHPIKAIASLIVHEDAHIQDMLTDDRPPKAKLDKVRLELQKAVDDIFDKWPEPVEPYTEEGELRKAAMLGQRAAKVYTVNATALSDGTMSVDNFVDTPSFKPGTW